MEHYGKTMKKMRLLRSMSQADLCKNIMSRSNLSRFENQEYIPGFDKIIRLLKRLNVEVDEFLYVNNGYQTTVYDILYKKLIYAENRRNKPELIEAATEIAVHKESSERFNELYFLSQLAMIENNLTAEATIDAISVYMRPVIFNTENWLFADFRRLNNFLRIFTLEEAVFLYGRAMKEFEKYEHFSRDNNIQIYLALNLGQLLAANKKDSQAVYYFKQAKKYAEEKNKLFQKLAIEASMEKVLSTGEYSHKIDSFRDLLDVLNQIGYEDTVNALKNYYH